MKTELLKKVPWKTVCKVTGVALVGVASVLGAIDSDEKVQTVVKKLAAKAVESSVEES